MRCGRGVKIDTLNPIGISATADLPYTSDKAKARKIVVGSVWMTSTAFAAD